MRDSRERRQENIIDTPSLDPTNLQKPQVVSIGGGNGATDGANP
jgi:hypothetical protein